MLLKDVVKDIRFRQILTSRGIPTIEVEFVLESHSILSSTPSGKSTGSREACCLVDNGSSYLGQSVHRAMENIRRYKHAILERRIESPNNFDDFLRHLDGTETKSVLGANAILPLSICYFKFYAGYVKARIWELLASNNAGQACLPIPNFNVLNGGLHSGNHLSCQEMMVCFKRPTYAENLECASVFFQTLKMVVSKRFGAIYQSVGDEGGYAPPISRTEDGLDLLIEAGKISGLTDFRVALDFAANSFFIKGQYNFDGEKMTGKELASRYLRLVETYKAIYMIEDPFSENDLDSWVHFYSKAHEKVIIVSDDLTVTNAKLISKFSGMKMFNGVLIKPNQIGTVTETLEAIRLARSLGHQIMVSHRSAETEDTFIASLAVGAGAEFIKAGAPCRGERVCKYNELLRIEEQTIDRK